MPEQCAGRRSASPLTRALMMVPAITASFRLWRQPGTVGEAVAGTVATNYGGRAPTRFAFRCKASQTVERLTQSDSPTPAYGFTLVEMAVVIVVSGLVMMGVLPALTGVRSANQRSLTQSNLQALMIATASYVQANGCLPCPTPASTVAAPASALCAAMPAPHRLFAACVVRAYGLPPIRVIGIINGHC